MHPAVDQTLENLKRRVADLARHAGAILGIPLPPFEVRADLRGVAAGKCHVHLRPRPPRVSIRFNVRVLEDRELLDNALAETAPHEVAHGAIGVWAYKCRRRVRPHGKEWLALCQALGGSGATTHRLPLKRARRHREYEYRLADGALVWLGAVRHRRLQAGRARYFYRRQPVPVAGFTGRERYRD